MTTNVEIIEGAYRTIGVVGESQSVSAEQGAVGLSTLNQLMSAKAVEDWAPLGYFTQTSTTDTCPIPDWAEMGVISALAQQLLTLYPSAQAAPGLSDDSTNGIATINRICLHAKLDSLDTRYLGYGSGGLRRWNIVLGP
jgi:hypothetical protein